jgi:aminocarboxymuconate-semialdehyde decarboxylase
MMRHKLMISVGQPLEETFALSSLVYDGVMDECPQLKIVIAHGGGYIPFYAGRHDHMYRTGLAGKDLKGDFSSYLNSFYYDSVLFNPDMLETLGHKVDPSHIILATDYPFGEWKPLEFVERATRLPRDVRDAIAGENAARLFGLSI